jgi:drug/metabolite transporter (DMT)-like permease
MTDALRAILAMVASMLCFSAGDTLIKLMGYTLPVGEMLLIRGIVGSLVVLAFCAATGAFAHAHLLLTPRVGVRFLMEAFCSVLFFIALVNMSFADVAAIAQFTPVAVMAGAAMFLGEAVGWRRWLSAAIGLVGVLLIIKPGSSAFQPMALVALASVIGVAIRDLVTRRMPKALPTSLLAASSTVSGMIAGVAMAPFEHVWHWPNPTEIAAMAVCAVFVLGAYVFGIIAMRIGLTSVTSPFRYTYMLFATLSSLLVFRERPDTWSLAGIGLIIGAGLYMLHREQIAARQPLVPATKGVA